jgi:hypothetical protein
MEARAREGLGLDRRIAEHPNHHVVEDACAQTNTTRFFDRGIHWQLVDDAKSPRELGDGRQEIGGAEVHQYPVACRHV